MTLSSAEIRGAALASRFTLVGLTPATKLDGRALGRWLEAGYAADMSWMADRLEERLDPARLLPGVRTVVALAILYRRPRAERSLVASYARGRDYHYTHLDRMRDLRRRLRALEPSLGTYACVDAGAAMEKVWAERAGLGWIGKNGCLIHPTFGSYLTLSVLFIDREVDAYDAPHANLCGTCTRCLAACPTDAFPSPGVVDARRCISYQSIENRGRVPEELRRGFKGRVFGCDVCQSVCPFNHQDGDPCGDARYEPRRVAHLSAAEIAALSPERFRELTAGTAVARAKYDGLRRNALLALGAARDLGARSVIQALVDDASPLVRDAARWALECLDGPAPRRAP